MRDIYANIELVSGEDIVLASRCFIGEDQLSRISVKALVDTGSSMLVINETIQESLQLPIVGTKKVQLANGETISCNVVAPIEVRFKNRSTTCRALVMPGNPTVILGTIPLMEMDVLIDPLRCELIVHPSRPDMAQVRL